MILIHIQNHHYLNLIIWMQPCSLIQGFSLRKIPLLPLCLVNNNDLPYDWSFPWMYQWTMNKDHFIGFIKIILCVFILEKCIKQKIISKQILIISYNFLRERTCKWMLFKCIQFSWLNLEIWVISTFWKICLFEFDG